MPSFKLFRFQRLFDGFPKIQYGPQSIWRYFKKEHILNVYFMIGYIK